VWEVDAGADRQVGRGAARLYERRQTGDMVGLDMSLEDADDRRPNPFRLLQVRVDELDVRVDDGKLALRQAAEQVARARRRLVEEGAEDLLSLAG